MSHLLILPILLPMFAGCLLLLGNRRLGLGAQRALSLFATLALLPLAGGLMVEAASGPLQVYALGNWVAPFGIVLVLDRLSALLLLVTALLALFALLYAVRGDDQRGASFHALFQFQLMGVNGAFLTGDLFNLFVFFEILLIASYALLLHGGGVERVKAGLHYVVLNLVGSSLFLIALGLLYGIGGTLNMADLARHVALADAEQAPLLGAAGLLLLVVFGLKAAMLPLYFWLPRAYASASAPVAALFAIMTKVGVYAILRVFVLVYGEGAGLLAQLAQQWLWPLALVTLGAGVLGALSACSLPRLIAYLVVVSVGTLLAGVALDTPQALSATLYYLIHSTWIAGGMFLLSDVIARQRGSKAARLEAGPALLQPQLLGGLYFIGAIGIAGLPPLSGFFGKLMLLRATPLDGSGAWLWAVLLLGSLGALVALSRAGSVLFWRAGRVTLGCAEDDRGRLFAAVGLLALSPLLVLFAAPLTGYLDDTVMQLKGVAVYETRILQGGGQ